MGPGGVTEVEEGSLNGESDVDEVDEVDGGEEVVGMTGNEPELASFTTVTWPGKTGPVTLHKKNFKCHLTTAGNPKCHAFMLVCCHSVILVSFILLC